MPTVLQVQVNVVFVFPSAYLEIALVQLLTVESKFMIDSASPIPDTVVEKVQDLPAAPLNPV